MRRFVLFGRSRSVVLSVLAVTTAGVPAAATTFTSIADTGGPYSRFNAFSLVGGGPAGTAAVSNDGRVVFFAELDGGGEGVFTGSGGTVATIATTASGYTNFGENPSISGGTVAFTAVPTGGTNTLWTRSSAGTGSTFNLADSSGPLISGIPNNPALNTAGKAAFRAFLDAGGDGIVRADGGGAATLIVDTTGPFDLVGPAPSINAAGTVAFQARHDGAANSGIYTGSGGAVTTIATSTDSTFANSFGNPDLNDTGTVVFRASLDAGGSGVIRSTAGGITTVADTSGLFATFGNVDVNNVGLIAFLATLDAGGSGIYTSDGSVLREVIGTGDALFGSTVTHLAFLRGLNDSGNVAFVYQLANGTQGVALAVPEPGSASVLLLGGAALCLRRRRRTGNHRAAPSPTGCG